MRSLAAGVVLALLLAGCSDAPADTRGVAADPIQTEATPTAPFRFDLDRPFQGETWANGSFASQEAFLPAGFVTGDHEHIIDISDLAPEGVPTRINLRLEVSTGPGTLLYGLDLIGEETWFYEQEIIVEDTFETVNATLVRHGPLAAMVTADLALNPDGRIDYTLHGTGRADAEWLMPGIPVAAELVRGVPVDIGPSTHDASVLLYGPDDELIGRPTVGTNFTPDSSGEHVLMVPAGGGPVHLSSQTATVLRPLWFQDSLGDPHPLDSGGSAQWDFGVGGHPLAAGIYIYGGEEPVHNWDERVIQVVGPEAEVLDRMGDCGVESICLGHLQVSPSAAPGELHRIQGPLGHRGLVPGTYTAQVTLSGASVGGADTSPFAVEVGHIIRTYAR